jgi:DNA modification methylase
VGSGTALVEAVMLGLDSVGIDIDTLSCYITKAKIDLLTLEDAKRLDSAVQQLRTEHDGLFQVARDSARYTFPPWIARKFEKWHATGEQSVHESQISEWVSAIRTVEPQSLRRVFEVCLSDALSRKFNIRMMGTGVGRFALEIADTDIGAIMESSLENLVRMGYVGSMLRSAYGVAGTKVDVLNDSAIAMPLVSDSVSLILTSPPYLPASSGRENYLVGKSISITALGIMTPTEIVDADNRSVGSMKFSGTTDLAGLPTDVADLYNWLRTDSLRTIKAEPTALYYMSLRKALVESYRVLQPGGLAVYVIGKESVFYQFSTRQVLYRVPCDKIFTAMAADCGFTVEETIDVELNKKNRNARPRGLDSYYETAVFLRKPRGIAGHGN